jgi:hypothetical protein
MSELITIILKIVYSLFSWWLGDKLEKQRRAKEIADLFKTVSKDGDKLADQIKTELNKHSNTTWDDIPIRK